MVNKSLKCSTWVHSEKQQNDLGSFPRQTIQHHSNPSLCPNTNAEEAEVEGFYEDLQDLLELPHTHTHTQRHHFHHRGLEFKSRKSRDTWNNSSLSRAKANRVLHRKHNGHSKHPLPTTKKATLHMDITKWSILKSD